MVSVAFSLGKAWVSRSMLALIAMESGSDRWESELSLQAQRRQRQHAEREHGDGQRRGRDG